MCTHLAFHMNVWIKLTYYLNQLSITHVCVLLFFFVSSPEHNMLKVSFCDCPKSVMHRPPSTRGHISCSVDLKIGQNICLDEISDELKFGSSRVKNLVTRSN